MAKFETEAWIKHEAGECEPGCDYCQEDALFAEWETHYYMDQYDDAEKRALEEMEDWEDL